MRVYVDGISVRVPDHVATCFEAHAALGIAWGEVVGLQSRPSDDETARLLRRSDPLSFVGGWHFEDGDRYVRLDMRETMEKRLDDLAREPWQRDPEDWKP